MSKAIKVLWIEDETSENLRQVRIQMELDDRINIFVADNAREAHTFLKTEEFDVILVDIILPPGFDEFWLNIRQKTQKLGFELIKMIFNNSLEVLSKNIVKEKYGVITIERKVEIEDIFESKNGWIKDTNYRNKDSILDGQEFIEFIEQIYFTPK